MIGYFKERSSFQFPALVFLALLLKIAFVSQPSPAAGYFDAGGLLPSFLNKEVLPKVKPGLLNSIGLLLLIGSAIYANFIISNRRMFSARHMLVALCILLYTSLFPGTNLQLPSLILLPLLVAIFAQITKLYNTSSQRSVIVNAGILAGLCYLLYHPFVFIIPACFFGLAYMRPFKLAEWALLLLGMATPLYFVLAAEFLTNHWNPQGHLPQFGAPQWNVHLGPYWWLAISTLLVWVVAAIAGWQRQSRRMVIQGRKNWYALIMLAIFCVPGTFMPQGNALGMLTLLSFPAGGILASAFSTEGKGIGHMLFFWLLIIVIAIVSWGWQSGAML